MVPMDSATPWQTQDATSTPEVTALPEESAPLDETPLPQSSEATLAQTLRGERPFRNAVTGDDVLLDAYLASAYAVEDAPEAENFAVVDMDGDGVTEALLAVPILGDTLVLRYDGGEVYGYGFGVRQMNTVKTDGAFAWSNSAFESGWSRLSFSQAEYVYTDVAQVIVAEGGEITYTIGGEVATEEEYASFIDGKSGIAWHPLTEENISAYLLSDGE
jgi:hypothetical protein